MALNQNHTFEDLDGIKCSIVEKNCSTERVNFLRKLLEVNNFKVVVVKSPPAKVAAVKTPSAPTSPVEAAESIKTATGSGETVPQTETFTVGVTDLAFNLMNALFNRELKTEEGKIVLPEFWKQETPSAEDNWYWKVK